MLASSLFPCACIQLWSLTSFHSFTPSMSSYGAAALAGYGSKGDERGQCSAGDPEECQLLCWDETKSHASPGISGNIKGWPGVLWQHLQNVTV